MTHAADAHESAFLALLEAHRGILFKTAAAYCRTATDREDLTQEMIAALWRAFPRYDRARPFATWMYRVVLNVAIGAVRMAAQTAARRSDADVTTLTLAAPVDEPDDQLDRLTTFVAALDPIDKALMLLYLDDVPYREIAAIAGLSETNVATKLNRIRRRAKAALAPRTPDGATR